MLIVQSSQWVSLYNIPNMTFCYLEQCHVQLWKWDCEYLYRVTWFCVYEPMFEVLGIESSFGHINQVFYYQNRSSVLGSLIWLHFIQFSFSARVYFLSLLFSKDWFRKTLLWALPICKFSSFGGSQIWNGAKNSL